MEEAELRKWQVYVAQRIKIDEKSGCWLWTRKLDRAGYGVSSYAYKQGLDSLTHRLIYTVFIGPIPDGLLIRHQCSSKPCGNPGHVLPGTAKENKADERRHRQLQ